VRTLCYEGADVATASPAALSALTDPALAVVIVCPSNPWLSIAPLLAIPMLADAVRASGRPVVAVSPLIAGRAVKGPTAKLMAELGFSVDVTSVARFYGDLVTGHVLDDSHAHEAEAIRAGAQLEVAPTLMTDLASKTELARRVLAFAATAVRRG